jgi:hypothetical protein
MADGFVRLIPLPSNNKYLAYRKNATGEIGWIKVSMGLYSSDDPRTITFKIDELLVPTSHRKLMI